MADKTCIPGMAFGNWKQVTQTWDCNPQMVVNKKILVMNVPLMICGIRYFCLLFYTQMTYNGVTITYLKDKIK